MNFFTIPLMYCCKKHRESVFFTRLGLYSGAFRKAGLYLFLSVMMTTGLYVTAAAQDNGAVRGRVTGADGNALTGVSVSLEGTSTGATTDAAGNYSINAPNNGTLVFSYVGFVSRKVPVNGQQTINVVLEATSTALEEVVVTALGIERQARSLTYSTQSVDTEQLTKAREPNIMNSLQGKVAGMSINSSGGGVGAAARVVLRGNRSISGDSQPLYVVDGVPVRGNPQDLSSDNIASINILKGPNAAALYGSAAQNGVIVVETKRGQAGVTDISLSSTYMMTNPYIPIKFQNEFGQGAGGVFQAHAESAWGARLEGQQGEHWSRRTDLAGTQYPLLPQPDNKLDVFQNGHNWATNVLISTGGEKTQTVFSYTYTNSKGILPGNDLGRHNVSLRIGNQLTPKLKIDSKVEYINQTIDNMLQEGAANFNPVMQAYMMPPNIRTSDARNFEFISESGLNLQDFWNPSSTLGANPYWTLYRNQDTNDRERALLMTSLSYQFTDDLSLMIRGAYDGSNTASEERLYNDTFVRAPNGRFSVSKGQAMEWNGDFLLSYNKQLNSDWNINANVGGNMKSLRNTSTSSNTGLALLVPNFFAMSNTLQVVSSYNQGDNMNINSLYAFGQVSWKNAIYFDVTGRNDWSSTLPADNRSYFYPSLGLSVILSDLIDMPDAISFTRLRSSWAQVGNSAPPYMLARTATFRPGGNGGFVETSNTLPNKRLVPEKTTSTEIGLDMRFFADRLGLDLTAYKTNTSNQLFTVALPVGSGASQYFTNGGNVENKGIEALLTGTPVKTADFSWDLSLNWALNRNLVTEISDERPRVIIGNDPYVREFVIEQGKPFGEIYSRGWLRDDQNRVIVDANGMPRITAGRTVRIANFNPDWMGGLSTSFTYKNFSLSALIEHRQGGELVSMTNAMLFAQGLTEQTLVGRNGGLVFGRDVFANETAVLEDGTPNSIAIDAETFWTGIGGRNTPVGEAFVESATNTRLRELTLGYSIPLKSPHISNIHVSLVGRNLFFLYRASDSIEPDLMQGVSPDSEGFQAFPPPTTRSYGLNLRIDF
ncbi:SusC/RagA family TonB-linked outer membrane protein [Parapedobacter lycopersici]|uniref:SusC/RagA family TonB-linked outer membrane protein n=1 Tax=Parapedobacter lycopersici TaxID=1864939 RepID=UPI00214DC589|nr:SusC/RagA family TonB-linked outer membrane protein [Parapedobacter lycopersici]